MALVDKSCKAFATYADHIWSVHSQKLRDDFGIQLFESITASPALEYSINAGWGQPSSSSPSVHLRMLKTAFMYMPIAIFLLAAVKSASICTNAMWH